MTTARLSCCQMPTPSNGHVFRMEKICKSPSQPSSKKQSIRRAKRRRSASCKCDIGGGGEAAGVAGNQAPEERTNANLI